MEIAVAAFIGKGLLAGAISDLYSYLKSSTHSEELEAVLQDLDIRAELDVVQALLEDLDSRSESLSKSKVVHIASENVKKIVESIHTEIAAINTALEYHRSKYFYYWRSLDYEVHLKNLRKYKVILTNRTDRLIQVIRASGSIH